MSPVEEMAGLGSQNGSTTSTVAEDQHENTLSSPANIEPHIDSVTDPRTAILSAVGSKRPAPDGTDFPLAKRQEVVRETVIRLLVPSRKAAVIIGKQGAHIKELKESTGAKVKVVEGIPGCDDRVVLIYSANTTPNSDELNPAQKALIEAYKRAYEAEETTSTGEGMTLVARLLVSISQASCIIGKQGVTIKQTRDATGAHLKVLAPEELPICALSNDRVVVLMGSFSQLLKALHIVSNQIRDNPTKEKPTPHVPSNALAHLLRAQPPAPAAVLPRPPAATPPPHYHPLAATTPAAHPHPSQYIGAGPAAAPGVAPPAAPPGPAAPAQYAYPPPPAAAGPLPSGPVPPSYPLPPAGPPSQHAPPGPQPPLHQPHNHNPHSGGYPPPASQPYAAPPSGYQPRPPPPQPPHSAPLQPSLLQQHMAQPPPLGGHPPPSGYYG